MSDRPNMSVRLTAHGPWVEVDAAQPQNTSENVEALRKLIASDPAGHVLDALAMARRLHVRGVVVTR